MERHAYRRRLVYLIATGVLIAFGVILTATRATAGVGVSGSSQAALTPVVELPYIVNGQVAATPTPTIAGGATPTRTPTPVNGATSTATPLLTATPSATPSGSGAVFLPIPSSTAVHSNGVSVARDSSGAYHVGLASWGATGQQGAPAYYAYCAASCAVPASWAVATLNTGTVQAEFAQLALDPSGHPRMLLYGVDSANAKYTYQYATCDAGCTNAGSWAVITLVQLSYIDPSIYDYPQHNFALDPQGRPRFVYYDTSGPAHTGTFYAYCDNACSTIGNWFEGNIDNSADIFFEESLAFTSAGSPRLAAVIYTGGNAPSQLSYLACDSSCTSGANWTLTAVTERGSGQAAWSLRLTTTDQPRIAFFQATTSTNGGNQLFYLSCNASCTAAPTSWTISSVGLASSDGQDPDLALNSQNQPRISYHHLSPDGLGYAWCTANCDSTTPSWQSKLVEGSGTLDTLWPILPPANCTYATWFGGYRSSLALDANGNPGIGYVGINEDGGVACYPAVEDYRSVRFTFLPGP